MRESAALELAHSYAGAQTVAGPILVVPYTERWTELTRDDSNRVIARVPRSESHVHLVFPERLRVNGELTPDKRYRGIFTVLFYSFKARVDGHFAPFDPSAIKGETEGSTIEIGMPVLAMGMGDVRGLQGAPKLSLAGDAATFMPRVPGLSEEAWPFQSVHAALPAAAQQAWTKHQKMDFQLDLALTGQSTLGIMPIADETTAHIASTWKHPSFGGSFLAAQRVVNDHGFEADWAVSSLSTSARAQLARLANASKGTSTGPLDSFNVTLVDPLDVYALTGRAVKYGLLFVALTLMAAFMFEVLRQLRLHVVQYGLVALSITLFFLLLLALSEKIAFGLAYGIATGSNVALLTLYFSAVLGSIQRGLGLGFYVGLLYAALYGLLLSEDNALLLGSVLLFGLLAFLMIATRKVDWYALRPVSAPAIE
jgi:inner membrane protein